MFQFLIFYLISIGMSYALSIKLVSTLVKLAYKEGYKFNLKKIKKKTNIIHELTENENNFFNINFKYIYFIPGFNLLYIVWLIMMCSKEESLDRIVSSEFLERITEEEKENLGDNPSLIRILQETVELKIRVVRILFENDYSYVAYYESKSDYLNGKALSILHVDGKMDYLDIYQFKTILLSGISTDVRTFFCSEQMDKNLVIDKIKEIIKNDKLRIELDEEKAYLDSITLENNREDIRKKELKNNS